MQIRKMKPDERKAKVLQLERIDNLIIQSYKTSRKAKELLKNVKELLDK